MKSSDPTSVGRVRHVLGATVTVALDDDVAGITPIYRGEIHRVGQIGSLVRIPQGLVDLIATVELVGIAELAGPCGRVSRFSVTKRGCRCNSLARLIAVQDGSSVASAPIPGLTTLYISLRLNN